MFDVGYSKIFTAIIKKNIIQLCTGVARNFDWDGPKLEKFCDVILASFFSDVMVITSLKWRHKFIFKV